MLSAYGDFPGVDAAMTTVARRILWPQVLIELNHELRAHAEFDQVVLIVRYALGDPDPFGMFEHAGQRRITVASSSDVSVSRNQLQLRLRSPQSVAVTNASEARSLHVAGCDVSPAERQFVLTL